MAQGHAVVTGSGIAAFQSSRIISGIALEVKTGMKVSNRGNILDAARTDGLIPAGRMTKKKALQIAVANMKDRYPTWEVKPTVQAALDLC